VRYLRVARTPEELAELPIDFIAELADQASKEAASHKPGRKSRRDFADAKSGEASGSDQPHVAKARPMPDKPGWFEVEDDHGKRALDSIASLDSCVDLRGAEPRAFDAGLSAFSIRSGLGIIATGPGKLE